MQLTEGITQARATERPLRGLWIARELPFPLDSGDRIYTADMARALGNAGADITFSGLRTIDPKSGAPTADPPAGWPIKWLEIKGPRIGRARALLSTMPLVGATFATPEYRSAVQALAREQWDFVVIDQYGMEWVRPYFESTRERIVLVHVAHDHETSVTRDLYRGFSGSFAKKMYFWQNQLKTARFERRVVAHSDLVTVITEEDSVLFKQVVPQARTIVLTPGYGGSTAPDRVIDAATPRHVIMVGSFHWQAKQENLLQFMQAADAAFVQHGIQFHVVGSMPEAYADGLRRDFRSIHLHGFVDSLTPVFAASRLAVVPEIIGGGFKLKYLDYIFGRVPVATLSNATAGLPPAVRDAMLCSPDMPSLVTSIVENIERPDVLTKLQRDALDAARSSFDWATRGNALLEAIKERAAVRAGAALATRA